MPTKIRLERSVPVILLTKSRGFVGPYMRPSGQCSPSPLLHMIPTTYAVLKRRRRCAKLARRAAIRQAEGMGHGHTGDQDEHRSESATARQRSAEMHTISTTGAARGLSYR